MSADVLMKEDRVPKYYSHVIVVFTQTWMEELRPLLYLLGFSFLSSTAVS